MAGDNFTASEIASVCRSRWSGDKLPPSEFSGIFTDTRTNGSDRVFFALTGEKFDAHDFLDQAISAGAAALCIKKSFLHKAPQGIPLLAVDDPLTAMQALAAFHRRRFANLKVAAVTGSVGKTSVKEMLRAIFTEASSSDQVLYTDGNTNNAFGVPQNLFRLTSSHSFAVIEMGTSSPGEIEPLSIMVQPDVAIINTIAECHLEKLIDLNGVAKEKSAIFTALNKSGTAVIPAEVKASEILENAASKFQTLHFGTNGTGDISAAFNSGDLFSSKILLTFPDGTGYEVCWNLTGEHQAANAAAAAAAAWALGIPAGVIARGLEKTELPGMRMKRTIIDGVTYINDAYNANPASMRAMINMLKSTDTKKLLLIMGGMRELGPGSDEAHSEILSLAQNELPDARIITVGKEFAACGHHTHFDNSGDALDAVLSTAKRGETVFAKGSRGTRAELALPPEAR